jgi:hypothetical protein
MWDRTSFNQTQSYVHFSRWHPPKVRLTSSLKLIRPGFNSQGVDEKPTFWLTHLVLRQIPTENANAFQQLFSWQYFACMIQRDYLKLWLFFLDVVIELPRTNLRTHYPVWWGTHFLSNELAYPMLPSAPALPPSAHTKDHKIWCKQIGLLYLLHASNSIGNNKQNSFVFLLRFVCFVDSTLGERDYVTMQSWFEECSQGVSVNCQFILLCNKMKHFLLTIVDGFEVWTCHDEG